VALRTPVRLQLSRAKGFNLQKLSRATNGLDARVVTRATSLGNPFVVGVDGSREECCHLYAHLLSGRVCLTCKAPVAAQKKVLEATLAALKNGTLKNQNLACSCRFDGLPCHAGILLIRANIAHADYVRLGLTDPKTLLKAAANPNILAELASR
jgi:hypothetical protein